MYHEIIIDRKPYEDRGTGGSTATLTAVCRCGWRGVMRFEHPDVALSDQARVAKEGQAHLDNPLVQDEEANDLWVLLREASERQRQATHENNQAQQAFTRRLVKANEFHVGDEVEVLPYDKNLRRWRAARLHSVTFSAQSYNFSGGLSARMPLYQARIYLADGSLSGTVRSVESVRWPKNG
jgi:hypothetical protein